MAHVHQILLTLDDKYYTQIGAILARWATLEMHMQYIIWRALKLDNQQGRVLTVGMGTQPLVGIIKNLPRKWITNKTITEGLDKLTTEVSQHVTMRNNLAHGIWTCNPSDPHKTPHLNYMKEAKLRILPMSEAVTPFQLSEFSRVVNSLNELATHLIGAIANEQRP